MGANLRHRSHLGARAADEAFVEVAEFVRQDPALADLDPTTAREVDQRPARDPVEEAVGDRRVQGTVTGEKHVRAGAFGDAACQSSIRASA